MSYINNGFFSNTFLKKMIESKITKEEEERIEDYTYPFDLIKEDLINIKQQTQINRFIGEEFLPTLGYHDFELDENTFKIYQNNGKVKSKNFTFKFIKKLNKYTEKLGKYQDLEVIEKAKKDEFKIAMITDGYLWRIYKIDVANYFESYIEIDIREYLKNKDEKIKKPSEIRILNKLIHPEIFNMKNKDEKNEFDLIFENSDLEIEKIEKELKRKMEEILSGIGLGFKNAIIEKTENDHFTEKERDQLYKDSITVLYRTLFIIYAESKELLPMDKAEYYNISLKKMIEEAKYDKNYNEEVEFWERLETIFSWIDKGHETGDLTLKAYNGGLFDNSNRNILGKYKIKNKYWMKTLAKLGYYEVKNQPKDKIDFTDLSTRSFGTLYEGILDYNMFIAEEDLVKRVAKSKVTYTPLNQTKAKKTDILINKGEIYLSGDALERKETGAYYTPEPIVEYIVKNTVDIKIDEALIRVELSMKDLKEELENTYNPQLQKALEENLFERMIKSIEKEVYPLSILDNAMGSGHFLVNAAYHVANKIYSFIHKNIKFNVESEDGLYNYNYWKRMVVRHNIYGVDINSLAVQLGKLSLWLISASKDKPLSFIDHHVKCGNSLVGTERISIDGTLGDNIGQNSNRRMFDSTLDLIMNNLKTMYKNLEKMTETTAQEVHEKEMYYNEIQEKLKQIKIKWNIYLSMQIEDKKGIVKKENYESIVNSSIDQIKSTYGEFRGWREQAEEYQFFHWELEFPEVFNKENKGFDCIIGNPPYLKEYTNKLAFKGLKNKECYQGKMDIWYLFSCKGIDLLKEGEILSYIATNNWVNNFGASKFRNKVIKNTKIIEFIDFGDCKVFESAGIQTMIMFLKKINVEEEYITQYSKIVDKNIKSKELLKFLNKQVDSKFLNYKTIINPLKMVDENIYFLRAETENILNKIEKNINFILNDKEVAQGIVGAPDKAFIVLEEDYYLYNEEEKKYLKKFYTNAGKYIANKTNKYIFYIHKENFENKNINEYPNIKNHFMKYKNELITAKIKYKTPNKDYYYLHRERNEEFFKEGSKIICATRTGTPSCTYTEDLFYGSRALNFIKTDRINLKYLTCILNSKLSNFWLKYKGKLTGDLLQIDKSQLLNIPIKNIKETKPFEILIDYIIFLKKQDLKPLGINYELMPVYFEQVIDGMIYELYFEEILKEADKDIIQYLGKFPEIKNLSTDKEKIKVIEKIFDRLYDNNHKVKNHLFYMDTIEEIKIIEGK